MLPSQHEYRAWLDALKPGDRVALVRHGYSRRLARVDRRTPARIVVEPYGSSRREYVDATKGRLGEYSICSPTAEDEERHLSLVLTNRIIRFLADGPSVDLDALRACARALGLK